MDKIFGRKIQFIAEIGSNHNGSLERAKQLIQIASELGFDAVKFQVFKADKLWKSKDKQKAVKKLELPIEWVEPLYWHAYNNNIKIGHSVFDVDSHEAVYKHSDYIKISSFDIKRDDLIKKAIGHSPTYISCGLATNSDIEHISNFTGISDYDAFFHCVSEYPASVENANLHRINEIRNTLHNNHINCKIGYSDHTKNIDVIINAVGIGASIIEMHFDLEDGLGNETGFGHVWKESDVIGLRERINSMNVMYGEMGKFKFESKHLCNPKTGLRHW